jgi:hypothetical protein
MNEQEQIPQDCFSRPSEMTQEKFDRLLGHAFNYKLDKARAQADTQALAERKTLLEGLKDRNSSENSFTLDSFIERAREYGLTNEDIKEVIKKDSQEVSNYSAIKETVKTMGNGIKRGIKPIFYLARYAFFMSSTVRTINDKFSDSVEDKETYNIIGVLGAIGASVCTYIPLFAKYSEHSNLAYSVIGAQLATNVLSGVYEIFRHQKKKIQEKKMGELENILNEKLK